MFFEYKVILFVVTNLFIYLLTFNIMVYLFIYLGYFRFFSNRGSYINKYFMYIVLAVFSGLPPFLLFLSKWSLFLFIVNKISKYMMVYFIPFNAMLTYFYISNLKRFLVIKPLLKQNRLNSYSFEYGFVWIIILYISLNMIAIFLWSGL